MTVQKKNTSGKGTDKADATTDRSNQTITALLENDATPVHVRQWLGRYLSEGDGALEHSYTCQESATMEQARLVYDVLQSRYASVHEDEFPEAARDFVEWYLYDLSVQTDTHVWNDPEAAVAALPTMLDVMATRQDKAAANVALAIAVSALTTKRERRAFLKGEPADTAEESKEDRDYMAAIKLSRYLADPRTPDNLRRKLGAALVELSFATRVEVEHPALVARACEVMFEAKALDAGGACLPAHSRTA